MLVKLILLALVATTQARPQQDSNSDVTSAHDLCPPDLSHYLLPHEYDCTKFYYCEYGLKWETPRDCSPGTEFSYELQVCVHPAQAHCTLPGVPDPVTVAPEDGEKESTEVGENHNSDEDNEDDDVDYDNNGDDDNGNDSTEVDDNNNSGDDNVDENKSDGDDNENDTTEVDIDNSAGDDNGVEDSGNDTTEVDEDNENDSADLDDNNDSGDDKGEGDTEVDENENDSTEVDDNNNSGGDDSKNEWLENGCPADFHVHWLLPHEDCGKFYYCNFGKKVKRSCSAGLHFNPVLQVCDWPENVGCQGNSTNGDSTEVDDNNNSSGDDNKNEWLDNGCPADFHVHWLLPHKDCGKFYYCNFGKKVERSCNAGLHFNPVLQVCDWPENAGCQGNSTGSESTEVGDNNNSGGDDNDNDINNSNENGNNSTDVDDTNNSGGDDNETEWLENGCPADFDIHWLLPHADCGKFYYCVFGEKVARECPAGLHFNPVLRVCDWPVNSGCKGDNTGSESTEDNNNSGGDDNDNDINNSNENGNNSTDVDDNNSGGDDNETEWLENGCPADFDIHWLLPHADCGKFYYCVFGEKVPRECPVGLHFNPTLQVCDWPENVGCEGKNTDSESSEVGDNNNSGGDDNDNGINNSNENGNNSTDVDDNNNSGGEHNENEWLENGCPADFDIHWLLPHADCGKFYYCVFGEKVARKCSAGLHFNPTLQVCDWPENVGCEGKNTESESTEVEDNNNSGGDDNDNGNHNSNENGNNSTDVDDNNNSGGDDNETEWLENGCPADFDIHWLLPHADCGKFYYCVFGEKVARECPSGLHFNPTLQVCDWPDNAECESKNNSNETDENNSGGVDNGDSTETDNNSNENNSAEDGNDSGESPNNSKCTDSCNVLPWAHETACDKFWRCEGDKAVLVICSEGLHFNVKKGTCDFICNANCVREYVQTTADSQGLKLFIPWNKVSDNTRKTYLR